MHAHSLMIGSEFTSENALHSEAPCRLVSKIRTAYGIVVGEDNTAVTKTVSKLYKLLGRKRRIREAGMGMTAGKNTDILFFHVTHILFLCLVLLYLVGKMPRLIRHELKHRGDDLVIEVLVGPARLESKGTLVIDVRKRLADSVPSDLTETRLDMQVGDVVDVMRVDTAETLSSNNAYRVLGLSCADGDVTDVEADRECLGIIEGIVKADKLVWIRTYTVTDVI